MTRDFLRSGYLSTTLVLILCTWITQAQLKIPIKGEMLDQGWKPLLKTPEFVKKVFKDLGDEQAEASFEAERDDSLPPPPQSLKNRREYEPDSRDSRSESTRRHPNRHYEDYDDQESSRSHHESREKSQKPYIPKYVSFKKFPEAYPHASNSGKEYHRPATRIDKDMTKYRPYHPPQQREKLAAKVLDKIPVFHDMPMEVRHQEARESRDRGHSNRHHQDRQESRDGGHRTRHHYERDEEDAAEEDRSPNHGSSDVEMSDMFRFSPGSLEALVKMDQSFVQQMSEHDQRREEAPSRRVESDADEEKEEESERQTEKVEQQRKSPRYEEYSNMYFTRPMPPMPPIPSPASKPGPPYQIDTKPQRSSTENRERGSDYDNSYNNYDDNESSPSDDKDSQDYAMYEEQDAPEKPRRSSSQSREQFYRGNSKVEEGDDEPYSDDEDRLYRDRRDIRDAGDDVRSRMATTVLLHEKIARSASNPQVIKVFRVYGKDDKSEHALSDTRITLNKKGQPIHVVLKSLKSSPVKSTRTPKELLLNKPKCMVNSFQPFCVSDMEYPINEINQALSNNKEYLGKFRKLIDSTKSMKQNLSENHATTACPSLTSRSFLKRARNTNGQWKVIVNVDRFSQPVMMQTCRYTNASCTASSKSNCVQKYSLKRLLAYEPDGTLFVDKFSLPSSCACVSN